MVLNRTLHLGTSWGTAWTPTDLGAALVWWAEADSASNATTIAGSTVPTDGATVGKLADLSGVGNHFLAFADDTTRPTFRSTAAGSPSVQFDGSNDALRTNASIGLFDAVGSAVFIAMRGNSPAANTVFVSESGGSPSGSGGTSALNHIVRRHATDAAMSDVFIRNDASGVELNVGLVNAADAFTGDKVIGIIDTGTNVAVYIDGVSIDNGNYTRSGAHTWLCAVLGASRANNAVNLSLFAGYLHAGLAMTDVPDATAIANITTYLGAKQGRSI